MILGAAGSDANVLAIEDWEGASVELISAGRQLRLAPGMRVLMCHDEGEDRFEGSFEELVAAGVALPLHLNVSKINIHVREKLTVLIYYVP